MEIDPARDLEIAAHVLTIAKTHKIDVSEALQLYIEKLKFEVEEDKPKNTDLFDDLKERLSPEKWELFMSYAHHHPTNEELNQAYYQAKHQGRLKPAKLLVGGDFYFKNSDFVGKKYLAPGIMVEAELYDNTICHVWLSPIECEFVFPDELEFIN